MVEEAIKEGKITAEVKDTYLSVGEASGVEAVRKMLGAISKPQSIVEQIKSKKGETPKSLEDYTEEELTSFKKGGYRKI